MNAICIPYHVYPTEEIVLLSPRNRIDYVCEDSEFGWLDARRMKAYIEIPKNGIIDVAKVTYVNNVGGNNAELRVIADRFDITTMEVNVRDISIQINNEKFPDKMELLQMLKNKIYSIWKFMVVSPDQVSETWLNTLVKLCLETVHGLYDLDLGMSVSLLEHKTDIDPNENVCCQYEFGKR